MWYEGIEMAKTAYVLDKAMEDGDIGRVLELAELLSEQVKDEVGSQAEAGGWYEEYDRATENPLDNEYPPRPAGGARDETFLTVHWKREDIVGFLEQQYGIHLDRKDGNAVEVEAVIDDIIAEVRDGLEEQGTQDGYETILALMPTEAVSRAKALSADYILAHDGAEPSMPPLDHVRDWYMQEYPLDGLGERINPALTFEDALGAASLGSSFYYELGVGDSIVRERVFQELADRNGVDYDAIYEAWLYKKPVEMSGAEPQAVSLKDAADESRESADALAGHGAPSTETRDDR